MNKLLELLSFSYPRNMGGRDRFIRAGAALVQPVLSLSEVIDGKWELALEILTILMIVTSVTGKCFLYHLTGRCTIDSGDRKT